MYDNKKYRMIQKLGEGGEGKVYLVLDENTKSRYAYKICFHKEDGRREADFLRMLRHPGIVRLHDCFYEADENGEEHFVLVTEFAEGKSLREYISHSKKRADCEGNEKLTLCGRIAEILEYLHSRPVPVVHGDLKPENIIVREKCDVILFDFGSAYRIGEENRSLKGSLGYASADLSKGRGGVKSDIYAFGKLMIYIYTGKAFLPEGMPSEKILIRMGVPKNIIGIIKDCLQCGGKKEISSGPVLVKRLSKVLKKKNPILPFLRNLRRMIFTNTGAAVSFYGIYRLGVLYTEDGKYILLFGCFLLIAELVMESIERERSYGSVLCNYSLLLSQSGAGEESQ